jgi:hypothetical protein
MKRYLTRRFAHDAWYLFVDADERFEYPLAECVSLRSLIAYLEAGRYRAMVAQMLDLFPDATLADLQHDEEFERLHTFYDLSSIAMSPYIWGAQPGSGVRMHWGGIRGQMFGTRNGLTKVVLARGDDDIDSFVGWHHTRYARVAELTGVLRHYPFAGTFADRMREAVTGRHYGRSAAHEYREYWKVLQSNADRHLRSATASEWTGVAPLIERGVIFVPEDYRRWAASGTVAAQRHRDAGTQ